jgi:hypothetical protein
MECCGDHRGGNVRRWRSHVRCADMWSGFFRFLRSFVGGTALPFHPFGATADGACTGTALHRNVDGNSNPGIPAVIHVVPVVDVRNIDIIGVIPIHGIGRQGRDNHCSRHVVARSGGLTASFGRCAAASRSAPHAAALERVTETGAVGHVAAVAAVVEHAAVLVVENVAVVGHAAVVECVVAEAVQNAAVAEVENAVVLVLVGFVYRRVGPAVHRHEQQLEEAKTKRQ